MIVDYLHEALVEPRAAEQPTWRRRSWAFVALIAAFGVASYLPERPGSPWLFVAIALATAAALRFRFVQPVATVAFVFGTPVVVSFVADLAGRDIAIVEATSFAAIVAAWALCRWASGREVLVGIALVVAAPFTSEVAFTSRGRPLVALASLVPWLLLAAAALVVRYRSSLRRRAVDDARSTEREMLARELHDTVAHHVSAIAIQAQAGQLMVDTDPAAALETLKTIERSASETLAEMRRMVGALRETGLAPQATMADVESLADPLARPRVEVDTAGLGETRDRLSTAVQASVYRIAQEAVTNARRHARNATRVSVSIGIDANWLTMRACDDGDRPSGSSGAAGSGGFGLVGMAERTELLGGTFAAGPAPGRGWVVDVRLPLGRA